MAILQHQSAAAEISSTPESRPFAWTDLLPAHRASTVAKTTLLVALGFNVAHGRFAWGGIGASLILTSLLWAALYAVNEAYDLTLEDHAAVPRGAVHALLGLCGALCLAAAAISPVLALAFLAMTAGQLAYCLPWPRLK